jgi:hypothetical protein
MHPWRFARQHDTCIVRYRRKFRSFDLPEACFPFPSVPFQLPYPSLHLAMAGHQQAAGASGCGQGDRSQRGTLEPPAWIALAIWRQRGTLEAPASRALAIHREAAGDPGGPASRALAIGRQRGTLETPAWTALAYGRQRGTLEAPTWTGLAIR